MKNTTRLAFSVYALALVLATSGAYAGSYDPTCDGNYVTLSFANMFQDPKYNGNQYTLPDKYAQFTPSLCGPDYFPWGSKSTDSDAPKLLTGDLAMFCYRIQAPAGSPYLGEEYDGKNVTGWKLQGWYTDTNSGMVAATEEIIIPAPASSENGLFSVDASEQYFEQAPETTDWRYSFEPIWDDLVYKLTLNTNCNSSSCGMNGVPGAIGVNYWLYVDGTGLYLSDDPNRLNLMTNSSNPVKSLPTRTGYTFEGFNVSGVYSEDNHCTPATLEAARKCMWITSNGHAVRDDLGKFYVESQGTAEPITTLKANWRPNEFNVRYNMTGGIPSAWLSNGYDMIPTDDVVESCVYDGACAVKANQPASDTFKFLGWKCTSSNCPANLKDKLLQTGDSLQNATAVDGAEITLTAQWAVRTYPVNVYAKWGDTTPLTTVYHVYNNGYYASEEAATNHTVLADLYAAVTKPTNGDNQLRGWVFGDNDNPVSATPVEVDTESLTEEYAEDAVFATRDGNFPAGGGYSWFIAGEDNQTLSVYGTWARNCAANLPNVATCELVVMEDGTVWYKNACDTGFHMYLDGEIVYKENMDKTSD